MYNKPIRAAIFACMMFLFFPNFVGADEAAIKSGEKKAMVCTACHGIENSNNPEWPNLSQQSKKYLVEQLHAFRDGVRNNALMSSQAMGLTDEDIYDLASYYNNVKAKKGVLTADDSVVKLGQKIYRGGIEDRAVPACISCHGPKGLGIDRTGYPKISGQHAIYTLNRLKNYKEGYDDRNSMGKNYSMMSSISFRLSNSEMKALSEYLQGLY
jgi:cytochrome c553